MDKGEECPPAPTDNVTTDCITLKSRYVPLGFQWDDIVQDGSSEKEIYSMTGYLLEAYREAEFWLKSKHWYCDRGIPWRRGWLMVGSPGTGKTALVRHMARKLDLPIVCFDLPTFTNRDFVQAWRSIADRAPCIALIEDIDAVFEGRRNVTDTDNQKGLTFDCFLNCLDGIQRNDVIFTIITSNRPETIDPAIGCVMADGGASRPGRIDRIIEVLPLDNEQKLEIANVILSGFEHLVEEAISTHIGETGACFVERCIIMAEKACWDKLKQDRENDADEDIEPVEVIPVR